MIVYGTILKIKGCDTLAANIGKITIIISEWKVCITDQPFKGSYRHRSVFTNTVYIKYIGEDNVNK